MQPISAPAVALATAKADQTAQALGFAMLKSQAEADATLVRLLEAASTAIPAKPPGQGAQVDRLA